MVRVVIVAGVRLYREGLAQLLRCHDGFTIGGVYSYPLPSSADLRLLAPDLVVIDLATTGSYDIVRHLKATIASLPIVAIGVDDSEDEVLACAEAGAAGYVTREGSVEELVASMQRAVKGELLVTPRVAGRLAQRLAALAAEQPGLKGARLSRREWEIAALIEEKLSNKEIAVRLCIEVATVKNHVHSLLQKLEVHRRTDAGRVVRSLAGSADPTPTLP